MHRVLAWLALALLAVASTGCGFHLRGEVPVPPGISPVHIQAKGGSVLSPVLADVLRKRGVQVTGSAGAAQLTIRLLEEKTDSRVLAVNRSGKVIAYELSYRVEFDAVGPGAKRPVEAQVVEQAREYVNADTEVLGKAQEADLIRKDLVQDLADRILRRLLAQLTP